MDKTDYKRFLNFLAAHDCNVDYRVFRRGLAPDTPVPSSLVPGGRRQRAAAERSPSGQG